MVVSDLNEGENSFRRLAENLPGIVYRVLLEDDNQIMFFNDMVQTMTGYRPEDLKKGKVYSLDPLILPEDKLNVINIVKDAIENNVLFEVEYRINNKSGELRWFLERGRPVNGDSGNPSYIDGIIFDITKRKETEQKLKESEARYRLITENANDLIVIVNKNFEYEYINEPVHIRLRGISENDRIGKSVFSIIHPEDLETAMKTLKEGFITGEGKIEVRLINKDGTYDWFEVRGKAFNDNDGNVKAILISRNINERKLTEQALIKSEKKFRNIFQSIPMGLHLYNLNPQGNLIFKGFNPAANKILNVNCEYFINKTIEEAFPPLVKTDIPSRYKLLAKKGGEWRWDQFDYEENQIKGAFEVVAFQTAPNTMVTSFKDITERIELENALRTSEEKYRLLFESIEDPIHVIDADLKIMYMNPAFKRWLKSLSLDLNVVGKTPVEAFPFIGAKVHDEYQKVFETKQIHIKEAWAHVKDTQTFTETRKIPILKSGNVVQVITIIRDFSDRKKAELKLKSEKEKAQKYLDIAGVMIVALNADQTVQLINQKGCEILEEEESNIIGINWFDNYIPDIVREQVKITFNRILNGEIEPLEYYENAVITKNGKERIISWHNRILKNEAGEIIGTLSSGQDVTESKKLIEELRIKDIIFNASLSAQSTSDINGIINLVNPAFLKLWGYKSNEEAIGNSVGSFFANPDDAVPVLETLNEKGKWEGEFLAKRSDGSTFISQEFASAIYNENGDKIGFQSANLDITKRHESEEKFRTIAEQSFMGINIVQNGLFKYFNRRAADIIGYSVEEIQNWKPNEFVKLIHPEDRDFVMEQARKKQEGKIDVINRYTYRIIKKSGEIAWMDNYSKIINYRGRPADLVMTEDITDKIIAEQQLKESEEKYRHLFENSPYYIILLDKEGNFIDCNNSTVDIYGFPKEDFFGKNFKEMPIIPPDLLPLLENVMELLFKGEVPPPIEFKPITKDGKIIWINSQASLIKLDGEFFIYIIGQDITERKKAERKLKESEQALKVSEEMYRSFVENFQGIAYQGYEDYSTDFFHGAVEEITGYTPEDFMTGRIKWNQLFHPDEASKFLTQQSEFNESPQTQLEYRIKAKDGSTHWILSKTQKFYDETKKKEGGRGIFIDITDKKKAEQQLKESEEKFRNIAEQSFMSIYIIQDGLIKYRNQRAIEVSGYSREEIQSWKPYEFAKLVHPEDRDFVMEQARKKQNGETDVINRYKYRIIKKSGEIAWIDNFSKTINYMGKPADLVITEDITEKILAEQKIKESEKKYRDLFESSPYFIGLIDEDGTLVDCNSSIREFLSMRKKEDVIGKKILDILSIVEENKEIIPIMKKLFQEAYSNEQGKSYEFKLHRSIGGFLWLKVEGSSVEINNRKLLQFIAQDITNRKIIEEDLKESEIKFRTIAEQFLMGIGILQDEEVKYANMKLANMYGYSVEEFIGKTYSEFLNLIHPEDRAKLIRQVEKRKDRTRDTTAFYQFRAFKKTGELFWATIYSRIITYQGKRAGLLTILDNTEIKKAELKLKESEEKFRKIAEQSFMGIIIRQHGSIKYVNDAALNIYGYSMDKIQEWSKEYIAESWVHSEDLPYVRKNRRTERQHDPEIKHYISYRINIKSGKLRWIDQYSKIILYQGEISELITIVDITEKKEAERLITEENKKLLELDKIRRDFLIRASHELKTPLNSIYSTSEFLLHYNEEILDEKLKQFLEIIYKGGKRLKLLIENLLDVSRIESDKFELNASKKNIRKIIENCIKEVEHLSTTRNVSILFEKSEDILLVLDKIRMEQVFVNIIVNAIKNTPNYGEVIIKTLQEEDHVKISIIDTGVGFTEEEKGKIFEKFGKIERYGQGMDIDTEGSGLGLFISKEIVELHGGKIEFKSDGRNKGSTFLIKLPIHTLN